MSASRSFDQFLLLLIRQNKLQFKFEFFNSGPPF